ncbi:putative pollen-specific leucine-rich repeat extensin-like protein 3 [Iris pallida]|uniref:Pollen-specific leucine-rich repeat extensin-like protein 3 n=1 Tax=Iris pallida TaxID=29817 RepID=A0AAX6DWC7_IRIPA|nr:putative pollen-specific leucine-rich repeat extensin-like protein 3 [Iris pallida]
MHGGDAEEGFGRENLGKGTAEVAVGHGSGGSCQVVALANRSRRATLDERAQGGMAEGTSLVRTPPDRG